jgi:tRNA(Ile)-lysidine synthase TilS/MesJ
MSDNHAYVLPMSGGLDSTYLYYILNKNNKNIMPFHVNIINE